MWTKDVREATMLQSDDPSSADTCMSKPSTTNELKHQIETQ